MSRDVTDTDPEPFKPGTVFHGRYEVLRCIGTGGMGAVYEVLQLETRRRRALKTLLPRLLTDPEARARFRLEAVVAADIDSDHIVEVLDAGIDTPTGLPFLVMELLKGENLGQVLAQRGRLSAPEAVSLLRQVSGALDRTHDAGVVHRDLKPENLFVVRRDDGPPRVKLLDFGIAKVVAESTLASTTRSVGTPLYMSPEQIRGDGDIGPRADLYSLGQIAFTLLVGTPYWEAEARGSGGVYSLLVKIMDGASEPASARARRAHVELPSGFDTWFERATALLPSRRFEGATELVEELARVLSLIEEARLVRVSPVQGLVAQDLPQATATLESVAFEKRAAARDSTDGASGEALLGSRQTRRVRAWERKGWSIVLLGLGTLLAFFVWRVQAAASKSRSGSAAAGAGLEPHSDLPTPARPGQVRAVPEPARPAADESAPSASSPGAAAAVQRRDVRATRRSRSAQGAALAAAKSAQPGASAAALPRDPTDIR